MSDQDEDILDATVPDPDQAAPGLDAPTSKPYDPDEFRDQARKRITYWLLILLTLVELLLGPIVALVSAATGFYFGAQSGGKKGSG